jgi:hypothetical protein
MKARPVKNPKFYAQWNADHDFCQCCGIDAITAQHERWPGLSTHHIVKFGRSDEACNLIRLCDRCHRLAERAIIRENGIELPILEIGMVLTIKMTRDCEVWDPDRLQVLRGCSLPDMMSIPEVFELEFRERQPDRCSEFFHPTT